MKKLNFIIIFFLVFIVFIDSSYADRKNTKRHARDHELTFDLFYFMSSSDKTLTKTKIYAAFCNDILQFVKESNFRFHAKYEIVLAIFDKKGNHVSGKTVTNNIFVTSFRETNLRKFTNTINFDVDLIPAEYKLVLELTDLDTKNSLVQEQQVDVKSFQENQLNISDLIFIEDFENTSVSLDSITPIIGRNFKDSEIDFGAYFNIYTELIDEPITLIYTIEEETSKNIVATKEDTLVPDSQIIETIFNLKPYIDKVMRYNLNIKVRQKDLSTQVDGSFYTSWNYYETEDLNLGQTIRPLKNIIKPEEWKWVEQATDSAKDVWYKNFWKQRDPTPDTEENELKEEFYERVSYSINNFSIHASEKEGWETDRGKIYIKYGPPTNTEKRSRNINMPMYEIWYYTTIERRFIFEDRYGNGDFRLVKVE